MKYYTPPSLANCLISQIRNEDIRTMVDICCGSWNLLNAAKSLFSDAIATGVDIDPNVFEGVSENFDRLHYVEDGRTFAVREFKMAHSYDLIVANPPFGAINKGNDFFEGEEFPPEFQPLLRQKMEIEMMLANLLLTHEGSICIFIMPITFILGDTYRIIRMYLAKNFTIQMQVNIPRDTFSSSGVSTCAIIIRRNTNITLTPTQICAAVYEESDNEWYLKKIADIPFSQIREGTWSVNDFSIMELFSKDREICSNLVCFRGAISSRDFSNSSIGVPVLHCSRKPDEPEDWQPTTRHIETTNSKASISQRFAHYGDIVVCRIGKGAGYWCEYHGETILVSDCLIVIHSSNMELVKKALIKHSDNFNCLRDLVKGVATQYITQRDIIQIINYLN